LDSQLSLRGFATPDTVQKDDAGVDASIELLIDFRYTNLRAQVQLKGTASEEDNEERHQLIG
jgi:Domain of unknown function (DUF4365)